MGKMAGRTGCWGRLAYYLVCADLDMDWGCITYLHPVRTLANLQVEQGWEPGLSFWS